MRIYEEPIVILLKLESEDVLTVSDPTADDLDWASIEANSNLFH